MLGQEVTIRVFCGELSETHVAFILHLVYAHVFA